MRSFRLINSILLCALALSVSAPAQAMSKQQLQGAGESLSRAASTARSAVVGGVRYSADWINRKIEASKTNFPLWARRRVTGVFRRLATPNTQELQVMKKWMNRQSLSLQEQAIWKKYKGRVYSSRGAIAAIAAVVIAILAAITGTAVAVHRKREREREEGRIAAIPAPPAGEQFDTWRARRRQEEADRQAEARRVALIEESQRKAEESAQERVARIRSQAEQEERQRMEARVKEEGEAEEPVRFFEQFMDPEAEAREAQEQAERERVQAEIAAAVAGAEVRAAEQEKLGEAPLPPVAAPASRQERIRAAARHQQETRKRVAFEQEARYRARAQARRERAQRPQEGPVSSLPSLGGSWVIIPGTAVEKWQQVKGMIAKYFAQVPEKLRAGEIYDVQEIIDDIGKVVGGAGELTVDEKAAILREAQELTSGQNPQSVTAFDFTIRGFGGRMPYADLEKSFGAANLSRIPEDLRRELNLNERTVYEFLYLDNETGPRTDFREMMARLDMKIKELDLNPQYDTKYDPEYFEEGLRWMKRNLAYYFRTKRAKDMYDAFISGRDYVTLEVDADLKDRQAAKNLDLMTALADLQVALS